MLKKISRISLVLAIISLVSLITTGIITKGFGSKVANFKTIGLLLLGLTLMFSFVLIITSLIRYSKGE